MCGGVKTNGVRTGASHSPLKRRAFFRPALAGDENGARDLGDGLDAAGFLEAEIPYAMENLQKVFDQLDSNGDGFIDVWEAQWIRRLAVPAALW